MAFKNIYIFDFFKILELEYQVLQKFSRNGFPLSKDLFRNYSKENPFQRDFYKHFIRQFSKVPLHKNHPQISPKIHQRFFQINLSGVYSNIFSFRNFSTVSIKTYCRNLFWNSSVSLKGLQKFLINNFL